MATPHVTGVAALLWMYRPQLSMQQVKQVLLDSVEKNEMLEGRIITGGRLCEPSWGQPCVGRL